jgi:hypothetical protein
MHDCIVWALLKGVPGSAEPWLNPAFIGPVPGYDRHFVEQTSGRQRLNIHGAIDLETGRTRMIEAATVNAISMIMLLRAIEAMYPGKRLIHLFVDNARYHHAKLMSCDIR